jgi:hypothetical protein
MSESKPQTIQPAAFEPLGNSDAPAKKGIPPSRWLLFALIALFALALWFLLSARSLEISVVADSEAEVEMSGLALSFGDRFLLRPGVYPLRVTAPGYHPYVRELTVSR